MTTFETITIKGRDFSGALSKDDLQFVCEIASGGWGITKIFGKGWVRMHRDYIDAPTQEAALAVARKMHGSNAEIISIMALEPCGVCGAVADEVHYDEGQAPVGL